jgi:hypothetical protein
MEKIAESAESRIQGLAVFAAFHARASADDEGYFSSSQSYLLFHFDLNSTNAEQAQRRGTLSELRGAIDSTISEFKGMRLSHSVYAIPMDMVDETAIKFWNRIRDVTGECLLKGDTFHLHGGQGSGLWNVSQVVKANADRLTKIKLPDPKRSHFAPDASA